MKHSIRVRFTMIFTGMTALLLVGIWCVNNWLLEDFYIRKKVFALQQAYTDMDRLVIDKAQSGGSISEEFEYSISSFESEPSAALQLLRNLNDTYNITLAIIDSVSDKAIFSSGRDGSILMEKVKGYILGYRSYETDLILEMENYTIQKTFDTRSESYYLESWGFYSDNSTIFMMSTPLASINESVALSNRFLAYVGLAALFLSSVIMYLTTKKVTSPILELANLSEQMSQLDFDAKYTGNAQDEVGVLGKSMNVLSDRLRETIGELKTANNELQKDIEEKIQIDEMRKDFIANVSHELKTPIALIQGYAEGLTEGMADEKESRDYYCEVIMDEANKMNTMVRQLLTLTALEFGNDTPSMERFDVVDFIQGVLVSTRILIEQSQADVTFVSTDPVYVWADEFKIEEVMTNYLSNALHHLDGARQVRIGIEQSQGQVLITVKNTGQPIPEEDLPNIWTKFYKVDKARTREYGGSGIGLSIVKAIMDSHGQRCGVYHEPDGVVFWFTLDADVKS